MLSVVFIAVGIISVFGDRSFTPQEPFDLKYNPNRIWVHLNQKCFSTQSQVIAFKDYLLSKYPCIGYNNEHKKIYTHPVTANISVWSLWLDKTHDLKCLDEAITLPHDIISACIDNVYYEPMYDLDCETQDLNFGLNLWSLDILDGDYNGNFIYRSFTDNQNDNVDVIILDTGVDTDHVEFSGLRTESLFVGTPPDTMSYDHGTHVAGTVVGHDVGAAKDTALLWFPTCQQGGSCSWLNIEQGYEAAIEYMVDNEGKRFVINYSVGGGRTSLNEAAYNAWGVRMTNAGGIWVTSAGNNNGDACNYAPSFTTHALTVGAYGCCATNNWPAAFFSNWGDCVDTWAPGADVTSSLPGNGYGIYSGTSMSSPNIAGLVVNLLKSDPSLTLDQIKQYLTNNARYENNGGNWGTMNQAILTCPSV